MSESNSLLDINVHFLQQGVGVLERITDRQYTFAGNPYDASSPGRHMRHILDHYRCFIKGWRDKIDYDDRSRDSRIEHSRDTAIGIIKTLTRELDRMTGSDEAGNRKVLVKSNEGAASSGMSWSSSTIKRELQFLISHTVHHYALIALILRIQGFTPPENFGVAPSTIRHRKEQDQIQF